MASTQEELVAPVRDHGLPLSFEPGRRAETEGNSLAASVLEIRGVSIYYSKFCAIRDVTLDVPENEVTALIGPSGCGKSTLLRSLNLMNEFTQGCRVTGSVYYRGRDIYAAGTDAVEIRRRIGMGFQKPNPFPKSIFKNVAWGARINGYRGNLNDLVEECLTKAGLWDEVRDKLNEQAQQ